MYSLTYKKTSILARTGSIISIASSINTRIFNPRNTQSGRHVQSQLLLNSIYGLRNGSRRYMELNIYVCENARLNIYTCNNALVKICTCTNAQWEICSCKNAQSEIYLCKNVQSAISDQTHKSKCKYNKYKLWYTLIMSYQWSIRISYCQARILSRQLSKTTIVMDLLIKLIIESVDEGYVGCKISWVTGIENIIIVSQKWNTQWM